MAPKAEQSHFGSGPLHAPMGEPEGAAAAEAVSAAPLRTSDRRCCSLLRSRTTLAKKSTVEVGAIGKVPDKRGSASHRPFFRETESAPLSLMGFWTIHRGGRASGAAQTRTPCAIATTMSTRTRS